MAERIIEFEGRRIAVPEDATDAEIAAILEQSAPVVDPDAAAEIDRLAAKPEQMTSGDELVDAITAGARIAGFAAEGANEGIAAMIGGPFDFVNALAQPAIDVMQPGRAGLRERMVSQAPPELQDAVRAEMTALPFEHGAFTQALEDLFDFYQPDAEPQGAGERIARRVGREVGAMSVPVGASMNVASRVGVEGARRLPTIQRFFVEPFAVNPGRALGGQTAAAVSAGTAAGVANEIVPPGAPGHHTADLVAALAGGFLPAAGETAWRGVGELAAAVRRDPDFASRLVEETATDALVGSSDVMRQQFDPARPMRPLDTDELVDAVTRPSEVERIVPGYSATTADRAADEGLARLEDTRRRGGQSGVFRSRDTTNADAVDAYIQSLEPDAAPTEFSDALRRQRDIELGRAATRERETAERAEDLARELTPPTTREQRGQAIRGALDTAEEQLQAQVREEYLGLIDDRMGDPEELARVLAEATPADPVLREMLPEGTIGRVRALTVAPEDGVAEPIPLSVVANLRSRVLTQARGAMRDPTMDRGGAMAARELNAFAARLDEYIMAHLSPDEAAQLRQARATRTELSDRFRDPNTAVGPALARGERGTPVMGDAQVAARFSGQQAIDELFDTIQAVDPALMPIVREAVVEEVLSRANLTDARLIEQFMTRYGQQLDNLGLRADVQAALDARIAQAGAAREHVNLQRWLGTDETPGRGPIGRYLQFDDSASTQAMRNLLGRPDAVRRIDQMLRRVGNDPTAVEGAKAAFWRVMDEAARSRNLALETASGSQPIIGARLRRFLDDPHNAAVAERLYQDNPEHLEAIRQLAEALRGVNLAPRVGQVINPSGSGVIGRSGVTMAEIGSKLYQTRIGRVSPAFVASYLAGKVARVAITDQRRMALEVVLDRALIDPDYAALLLRENNPVNRAAMSRALYLWGANEAATVADMLLEDDEGEGDIANAALRGRRRAEAPSVLSDDELREAVAP